MKSPPTLSVVTSLDNEIWGSFYTYYQCRKVSEISLPTPFVLDASYPGKGSMSQRKKPT